MLLSDTEIHIRGIVKANGVPFHLGKQRWQEVLSYGYSSAGYDVRLGHDFKAIDREHYYAMQDFNSYDNYLTLRKGYIENHFKSSWESYTDKCLLRAGEFVLAHTMEILDIPVDVAGLVRDKSTLARVGIAVQNTVLEPGWRGSVTLEISNHNRHDILLEAGMPIAQIQFDLVQGVVERPYEGRYQDQPSSVVVSKGYENE